MTTHENLRIKRTHIKFCNHISIFRMNVFVYWHWNWHRTKRWSSAASKLNYDHAFFTYHKMWTKHLESHRRFIQKRNKFCYLWNERVLLILHSMKILRLQFAIEKRPTFTCDQSTSCKVQSSSGGWCLRYASASAHTIRWRCTALAFTTPKQHDACPM